MAAYGDRANLLTIYISEAHAADTWPLGMKVCYNQTHHLEDRAKVAQDFIRDNQYEFELVLDEPPKNAFDSLFAAWPLRFYVIEKKRLTFICEPYGEYILITDLNKFFDLRFSGKK
jgi:hypothetical protein